MIDRYLLRYFLAVIDQGNFSRAAARCRVSQPTLSVGVAKLERLLDRPLFYRSSRRVELTEAGVRFAVHARKIEAEFAEAEGSVREDPPFLLIRIGVIPTLPSKWIERAVSAARAEGAGTRLELVEGRMNELRAKLDRGRVDSILGLLDHKHDRGALLNEGYYLALPRNHTLAQRETISANDVAREPMIVRRQCEALPAVSRFFTARGVRPFMSARTQSDEGAVGFVRAGLGITVMPRCFEEEGLAMPALLGFEARRTIGFRTPPDGEERLHASFAFQAFAEAFAAQVTK